VEIGPIGLDPEIQKYKKRKKLTQANYITWSASLQSGLNNA